MRDRHLSRSRSYSDNLSEQDSSNSSSGGCSCGGEVNGTPVPLIKPGLLLRKRISGVAAAGAAPAAPCPGLPATSAAAAQSSHSPLSILVMSRAVEENGLSPRPREAAFTFSRSVSIDSALCLHGLARLKVGESYNMQNT